MPNLNQILKEEIVRIAKREINKQVKPLKGQLVEMRKTDREQRRRIERLEKELAGKADKEHVSFHRKTAHFRHTNSVRQRTGLYHKRSPVANRSDLESRQ